MFEMLWYGGHEIKGEMPAFLLIIRPARKAGREEGVGGVYFFGWL